jgi:hypothetical protein
MSKLLVQLQEWWYYHRFGTETPLYYELVHKYGFDPLAGGE